MAQDASVVDLNSATTDQDINKSSRALNFAREDGNIAAIRTLIESKVLQRGASFDGMADSDPRYLALDWILHKDGRQLTADDTNLFQRYILALIAFSLDSLAWFSCGDHRNFGDVTEEYVNEDCEVTNSATGQIEGHKVWLSSSKECDWFGVICSSDEVVRGVELSKYSVEVLV